MKVALVTGILTPYTHRVFELIGRRIDGAFHVFACSDTEPGRQWTVPNSAHYHQHVLRGLRHHRSYVSHVYLNPGIAPALLAGRFDIIVVCGFSPTMLIAAAIGFATGVPVIACTDGQPETDPGSRSIVHRIARRLTVPYCAGGIGASLGSLDVLRQYGLPRDRGVVAPLAPGWDFAEPIPPFEARPFDLLFCGHLDEDTKGVLFFVDVAIACSRRGARPRVRVVGDGPLRGVAEERLRAAGVEARFDGYLAQHELAAAYASAKLFLFPSRGDTWGLVANEAIQCGTPVIVSPHARAAQELVAPFGAGSVVPLSVEAWRDAALAYLGDASLWRATQARTEKARRSFSIDATASVYLEAFAHALKGCDDAPIRQTP